jgi:chemotaxis protein MotA
MTPYTIASTLAGLLCLLLAIVLAADTPSAFLNLPGFLIVAGGTLAAVAASYPVSQMKDALRQLRQLPSPGRTDLQAEIEHLMVFSRLWFRHQYRQIDAELETLNEPTLKRGLQMLRDQQGLDQIMACMNWRIAQYRNRMAESINLFRSMATFAPAFGMVGSLVGLVNMLQDIGTGGIESVSADMAVALVTTFYGLMLANLLFKPIATKLEQARQDETVRLSLIAQGRTPGLVQDTLHNLLQGGDIVPPRAEPPVPTLTAKVSL